MEIIPVIDIKSGQAVLAQGGRRDEYQPIRTPLSDTSDPGDVAAGLLRHVRARWLYVADIDAIERRAPNDAALARIASAAPTATAWVDTGVAELADATAWLAAHHEFLVIGSESQADTELMGNLRAHDRIVLSLDFRGDSFQGPPGLLADPMIWPPAVIVMMLARVGASLGPDLSRVAAIVAQAGHRRVYAAGGVRHPDDLRSLAEIGAAGALVATALHNGSLSAEDLQAFA